MSETRFKISDGALFIILSIWMFVVTDKWEWYNNAIILCGIIDWLFASFDGWLSNS